LTSTLEGREYRVAWVKGQWEKKREVETARGRRETNPGCESSCLTKKGGAWRGEKKGTVEKGEACGRAGVLAQKPRERKDRENRRQKFTRWLLIEEKRKRHRFSGEGEAGRSGVCGKKPCTPRRVIKRKDSPKKVGNCASGGPIRLFAGGRRMVASEENRGEEEKKRYRGLGSFNCSLGRRKKIRAGRKNRRGEKEKNEKG